jgi:Xaa-Pro dipeptidase
MVPYLHGYWGDTCSTYVVSGESAITEAHRRIHRIARDAFYRGLEAIKPGITSGQLDAVVRDYVHRQGYDYPHHTGHGLGVSNHEEPRIIKDAPMVVEPGMVIVFEPAVYVQGFGGVRQERMILVTSDRAELLTANSFELA